ncbi:MAG TPA: hypothetical protein VMB35_03450 [Methanomicrobiales archaeon]|nr:hypothetical protein [Methanomicrobiales archaeon]
MPGSRFMAAALAALAVCAVLAAGCTGGETPPQPPASTLTIPTTTRPVTPVPSTPPPVLTGTTPVPYTTGVTPSYTPGPVVQAGSAILITGDVVGYKSPTGNFLDEIRFSVIKAPRAEDVTFEIPNTQMIFTKGGQSFGVNYQVLSGDLNANNVLEDGETFVVSIPFLAETSQNDIFAGQGFTMSIQNPPQPRVTVTTSAPAVLTDDPMVLARA